MYNFRKPKSAMETSLSGFTFFSNFDSGNLQKVSVDEPEEETCNDDESASEKSRAVSAEQSQRKSSGRRRKRSVPEKPPLAETDFSFKIWTRPDCGGTEFENGNRTWFYFGFRGSPQVFVNGGKVIKFRVMNLNKQSKLFSQGMSPIVLVITKYFFSQFFFLLDTKFCILLFTFRLSVNILSIETIIKTFCCFSKYV